MAWDETWRTEDRPTAAQIPNQYSPWPSGTGWLIFAYFAGVTALFVAGLYAFGSDPTLVFGLPVLAVISVFVVLAFLVGMLGVVHLERRGSE